MNSELEDRVLQFTLAARETELDAATARMRPSVLYRPTLSADGTKWMALYGENLAVGVAGFGDTPEQAMVAFDAAWVSELTPAANLKRKAT